MRVLIFGMPGTGKTTFIKDRLRNGVKAIDLDYKGPKEINNAIRNAHSRLIQTWFKFGVQYVATFIPWMDLSLFNKSNVDKVYLFVPASFESISKELEERDGKGEFYKLYSEKFDEWKDSNIQVAIKYGKALGIEIVELDEGVHISDFLAKQEQKA